MTRRHVLVLAIGVSDVRYRVAQRAGRHCSAYLRVRQRPIKALDRPLFNFHAKEQGRDFRNTRTSS